MWGKLFVQCKYHSLFLGCCLLKYHDWRLLATEIYFPHPVLQAGNPGIQYLLGANLPVSTDGYFLTVSSHGGRVKELLEELEQGIDVES